MQLARAEQRSVPADVVGRAAKGLKVEVYGLPALLPFGQIDGVSRRTTPDIVEARIRQRLQERLAVNVLRLDEDEGRIVVSERPSQGRQPPLFRSSGLGRLSSPGQGLLLTHPNSSSDPGSPSGVGIERNDQ
jgi:hypothetical protein